MKFTLFIRKAKETEDSQKYEVEFSVKYYPDISEKDKEKVYRIVRIIDSLGEDSIDERSDKDYRFQTDNDEGLDFLDGIIKKVDKNDIETDKEAWKILTEGGKRIK